MTTPDIAGLSNRDPATFPTNDPTNPLHRLADDLQRGRLKVEGVKEDVTYALSTLERQAAEIKRLRGVLADALPYVVQFEDMRDGIHGAPEPNCAMQLAHEIRAALTGEDT